MSTIPHPYLCRSGCSPKQALRQGAHTETESSRRAANTPGAVGSQHGEGDAANRAWLSHDRSLTPEDVWGHGAKHAVQGGTGELGSLDMDSQPPLFEDCWGGEGSSCVGSATRGCSRKRAPPLRLGSGMLSLAAGTWLERALSDMGGPRMSARCFVHLTLITTPAYTSSLPHRLYPCEVNFCITFHNGIIIRPSDIGNLHHHFKMEQVRWRQRAHSLRFKPE